MLARELGSGAFSTVKLGVNKVLETMAIHDCSSHLLS